MAVLALAAGLVVAGCARPGGRNGRPTPDGAAVVVTAREWGFEPSPLQIKAGRITFRVRNEGVVDHNFVIEQKPGAAIEAIPPGEARSVGVDLAPGEYTAYCSVPGHREAGMVVTIRVTP